MELNTVIKKRCRSRIQTHETKYTWLIENIRNYPLKTGDYYSSSDFTAGENNQYVWFLDLYINGYDDSTYEYVGIWPIMRDVDSHEDFTDVLVEISILDEQTDFIISKRKYLSKENLLLREDEDVFKKFVKIDDLFKIRSFACKGDLKIVCSIYFCVDEEDIDIDGDEDDDVALLPTIHEKINKHLADFEKILFNNEFSDFQLIIGDTKIPVHRAILAARSRVFSAMLSNDMLEKHNGSVTIEDVDVEVMRELLRFVYTGQVCNLDKIADKVLIAADKYEVNPLKQICENILAAKLNSDSIFATLQLVDKYDVAILKKAAIDYVMENAKKLAEKNDFEECIKQLSPDLSLQVIRGFIAKS